MPKTRLAAMALFIGGLLLFLAGLLTSDTEVYLAVIIPVIQTSSPLAIIGILLMFGAFFMWMAGQFSGVEPRRGAPLKGKSGGVILIGPIPIAFSNDQDLAKILMVVGVIAAIAIMLFLIFFL